MTVDNSNIGNLVQAWLSPPIVSDKEVKLEAQSAQEDNEPPKAAEAQKPQPSF